MISTARGVFKLRKVWVAPGNDGTTESELFEGYWTLKVVYGPTLRRKGFGSGELYSGSFWGVRALKKDGVEVGIDAGDGMYVSTSSYGFMSDSDEDEFDSDEDEFDSDEFGFGDGEFEDDYGYDDSEEEDDYHRDYYDMMRFLGEV